jgi:hypothetical protein
MNTQPLTPHEWDLLAGATRALAFRASEDAKRNDNPLIREGFQGNWRARFLVYVGCLEARRQVSAVRQQSAIEELAEQLYAELLRRGYTEEAAGSESAIPRRTADRSRW